MEIEKLIKNAYLFFEKNNFTGIYLAFDIGEDIVCFGGNPDIPFYGCRSVAVNKKTGECNWFIETDEDNEAKLNNAVELKIPIECMNINTKSI